MKKGVVVGHTGDNAVVLTKDGRFIQVKDSGCKVGDNVPVGMRRSAFMTIFAVFMLSFVAVGSGLYAGFNIKNTPVSFVSIAINPLGDNDAAIDFTLNASNEIVTANAVNEVGQVIIAGEDFNGKAIGQTLESVVKTASESGYMNLPSKAVTVDENNLANVFNAVMITVIGDSDTAVQQVKETAESSVNQFFEKNYICGLVLTQDGNNTFRELAIEHDVSVGKMQLLMSVQNEIDLSNGKKMPVKEIVSVVKRKHLLSANEMDIVRLESVKNERLEGYRQEFDQYRCPESKPVRDDLFEIFAQYQKLFFALLTNGSFTAA